MQKQHDKSLYQRNLKMASDHFCSGVSLKDLSERHKIGVVAVQSAIRRVLRKIFSEGHYFEQRLATDPLIINLMN